MSKKTIKSKSKKCFICGADAGLLSITLPSNRFLRPRTEAEERAFAELVETKALSENDVKIDRMRRKLRLCPQHIKSFRVKYGFDARGRTVPVQLWGQKKR